MELPDDPVDRDLENFALFAVYVMRPNLLRIFSAHFADDSAADDYEGIVFLETETTTMESLHVESMV